MKKIAILALCLAVPCLAKTKPLPKAPLPDSVSKAHSIFLENGGGSDTVYDTLYGEMKSWGRFQIAPNPESADLVLEISFGVDKNGTSAVPLYNSYTKQTTYYSQENIDPQVHLSIYDAHTKSPLWSAVDHVKLVRLRKNVDKERSASVTRLVEDLKSRLPTP